METMLHDSTQTLVFCCQTLAKFEPGHSYRAGAKCRRVSCELNVIVRTATLAVVLYDS